jgi:hypothetical protein
MKQKSLEARFQECLEILQNFEKDELKPLYKIMNDHVSNSICTKGNIKNFEFFMSSIDGQDSYVRKVYPRDNILSSNSS